MLRNLSFSLFILLSGLHAKMAFAQSVRGDRDARAFAERYLKALAERRHLDVLEQTEPGLIEFAGSKAILTWLEASYADPQAEVRLSDPVITDIKGPITTENQAFAQFSVRFKVEVRMLPPEGSTSVSEETVAFYQQVLTSSYPDKKVKYDKKQKKFSLETENILFGFLDREGRWTFVENRDETRPYLSRVIPPGIITQFSKQ